MEHYWSLRWLVQERIEFADAVVVREGTVRFDGMPLTARVHSLPDFEPGTRVKVEIREIDLVERTVSCAYRETLDPDSAKGERAALPE